VALVEHLRDRPRVHPGPGRVHAAAEALEVADVEVDELGVDKGLQEHALEAHLPGERVHLLEHHVLLDHPELLHHADRLRASRVEAAGLREGRAAPGPEHAVHLREGGPVVGHVVEGVHAEHPVERAVGEGEPLPVGAHERRARRLAARVEAQPLPRVAECRGVEVDGDRAVSQPVEELGDEAGPGGEVEDPRPRPELEGACGHREVEQVAEAGVVRVHAQRVAQGLLARVRRRATVIVA
jgi:hypothetical protein